MFILKVMSNGCWEYARPTSKPNPQKNPGNSNVSKLPFALPVEWKEWIIH